MIKDLQGEFFAGETPMQCHRGDTNVRENGMGVGGKGGGKPERAKKKDSDCVCKKTRVRTCVKESEKYVHR